MWGHCEILPSVKLLKGALTVIDKGPIHCQFADDPDNIITVTQPLYNVDNATTSERLYVIT